MTDFSIKIIPIVAVFFSGYVLKVIKIVEPDSGKLLLKLVFYVTLPALTFLSVANTKLTITHFYLPFLSVVVVGITFVVATIAAKRLTLSRQTYGTFLIGCLIMNTGFTMPFVIAAFGKEGLAVYTFFDLGNVFLIFTFIYYQAIKYGDNNGSRIPIRKFLLLPPIWGLMLGVLFNLAKWDIAPIVENYLTLIGEPTVFLMLLSLGIYFHPKPQNVKKIATVLLIRIGLGFLIGISIVTVFNLTGMLKTLIILFCAAPVGYNTLVFASLEKLDEEFAASIVSLSLLAGIIYIPLLLWIIH
jgi:malate permease and related proteins